MDPKYNLLDQTSQTFINLVQLIKERFEYEIVKQYLKDFDEDILFKINLDFDDLISNVRHWLADTDEDLQSLKLAGTENKITQVTLKWSEASEGYHYKIYYFKNRLPYVYHKVLYKMTYDGSKTYNEIEIIPTIQKEVIKIAKEIQISEPDFNKIPFIELDPVY